MPDISLCENNTCPSRKSCYRYTATPNPYRQTYGLFDVEKGKDKCSSYWNNEASTKNDSSRLLSNK
jgi:hypothetical protein